jgi:hypothetical protein
VIAYRNADAADADSILRDVDRAPGPGPKPLFQAVERVLRAL